MPPLPSYLDALYDAVCFKASHNSYCGPGSPVLPLPECFDAKYDLGCRGFELDLHEITGPNGRDWEVYHEDRPATPLKLDAYLGHLAGWDGHDPVFIVLDLKSVKKPYGEFAVALDKTIRNRLDGRLFSPGDLMVGDLDLVQSLRDLACPGWKPIGAMMGKFIFCLSGVGMTARDSYADHRPRARACFVDCDLPEDRTLTQARVQKGRSIIINVKANQTCWGRAWLRNNPGFLLRVFDLTSGSWGRAKGRANILATNAVKSLSVGAEAFAEQEAKSC